MKKTARGERCRWHADAWILLSAVLLILLFLTSELLHHTSEHPNHLSAFLRAFAALPPIALLYLGGVLRKKRLPASRVLHIATVVAFAMYLYLLINFTLLDVALGRWSDKVYAGMDDRRSYYMAHFVNFKPLSSIWNVYIRGFINGRVHAYYVALNLLGNLCAFMPFALLLPCFFKAQRRWYIFLVTMLLAVIAVESAQLLFMVGSCDVDDLILNAGGAMIAFGILRIPVLKKLTDRFYSAVSR